MLRTDEEIAMLEKDVKDSYGVVPDIHTLLSAEVTFVGVLPCHRFVCTGVDRVRCCL